MLCPKAKLPSAATVFRDVFMMYESDTEVVQKYFMVHNLHSMSTCIHLSVSQKHNGAVHLVMDGWTLPILACYLCIVAVWFSHGQLQHCILEFARYKIHFFDP